MLMLNLTKAYVASGKVSDTAFDVILKAPAQIKTEANPPRPTQVNEENWRKNLEELEQQAKDQRAYMAYAFFQLLPRLPEAAKRLALLDKFAETFPDAATVHVKALDYERFQAYKVAGDMAKMVEWGEKFVAEDPANIGVLNLLAYIYGNQRTNLDKAAGYAQKALDLATALKKPEGMTDEQFASSQKLEQGMAHLTLGYIAFLKVEKTRKVGPALQELKAAVDLLAANPELQAQTLYYIGYANETMYPANHAAAIEALTRAAALPSAWQSQARDLLAKVKRAARQ
jgi:tetratricopeptide (TPR) repeat protein